MRRRYAAALVAIAAAVTLAGCGYQQGPAGRVVGKHRLYYAATKQWHYTLTTRDAQGRDHKFRVTNGDYAACYRGSSYPKCTEAR